MELLVQFNMTDKKKSWEYPSDNARQLFSAWIEEPILIEPKNLELDMVYVGWFRITDRQCIGDDNVDNRPIDTLRGADTRDFVLWKYKR